MGRCAEVIFLGSSLERPLPELCLKEEEAATITLPAPTPIPALAVLNPKGKDDTKAPSVDKAECLHLVSVPAVRSLGEILGSEAPWGPAPLGGVRLIEEPGSLPGRGSWQLP